MLYLSSEDCLRGGLYHLIAFVGNFRHQSDVPDNICILFCIKYKIAWRRRVVYFF